jgi:hypothetical protein
VHTQIDAGSFIKFRRRRRFQSNNMWVNRLHRGRTRTYIAAHFSRKLTKQSSISKGATLFILCLAMHYRDNKGNGIINYVRQILRLDKFIFIAALTSL